MVHYCSAYGCKNLSDKNSDIKFHRFPFNRPGILKQWVVALRREQWAPTKSSRLCSQHFVKDDYEEEHNMQQKFLKSNAVPSIFNFSADHLRTTSNRRTLKRHLEIPENEEIEILENEEIEILENEEIEIPCKTSRIVPNEEVPTCSKYVDRACSPIIILSPEKQQLKKDIKTTLSPESQRLKKKIKTLNQTIRRCNRKMTSLKESINQLRSHSNENLQMTLQNHFSGFHLEFLLQQKKNSKANPTHRTYTDSMKMFAHTLYFYSPDAYNFVRAHFYLPSPRTLHNWLSKSNCNPGFLEEIFDCLNKEVQIKDNLEHCSSIFDSMAIRKQLCYDFNEDNYAGFHTDHTYASTSESF